MRSSAYECRLAETHHARRLRLLGSPPDLVHSGPVVQGPHPYAEPRSKALSDLVCSTAQLGAYRYFIILCPELQGAFVWVCFFFIYDLNPPTAHSGAPAACGGGPLALSQFSLRAAVRPCENWSAAPASPRCICRRQRSAQLPPSGGAGLFHLHHPEGAVCGLEGAAAQPRGKHNDRVQWTKQGVVFGAALRFLQAGSVPRRKNRLSARGKV